jgi:MYXO-CTERM domain-containing protein
MNPPNEERKPTNNMELLKQQAEACGSGCSCHTTGTPGKMRWVLGVIVLIAAGTLVARAVIKNNGASAQKPAAGFATAAFTEQPAAPVSILANTVVTKEIGGLSDLNTLATDMDGVFVFLPSKTETNAQAVPAQILDAARKIETQARNKIGMFMLKTSSPDYERIAAQLSLPGVLVLVKGKGMAPVTGEITETKLVQAYVNASSAGGCGPSSGGCGPSGCK